MTEDHLEPILARAVADLAAPVRVPEALAARALRRDRLRTRRRRMAFTATAIIGALAAVALPQLADPGGVTFAIEAPASKQVVLVGDFTAWDAGAIPLERQDDGRWSVTVPLPPGRYRFAYQVDGTEWRADPYAASIPDEFGQPTSIITVAN